MSTLLDKPLLTISVNAENFQQDCLSFAELLQTELNFSENKDRAYIALGNAYIALVEEPDIDVNAIQQLQINLDRPNSHANNDSLATWIRFKEYHPHKGNKALQKMHPSKLTLDLLVYISAEADLLHNALNTLGVEARKSVKLNQDITIHFIDFNDITLELVQNSSQHQGQYWGLGLATEDIVLTQAELKSFGINISDIRQGQKRNTLVATVKSHHLGIPCLLTEYQ